MDCVETLTYYNQRINLNLRFALKPALHTNNALVQDISNGYMTNIQLTYNLPADPVVCVIKRVSFALKQLGEQGPQVLIVRLFEEIQPPDVAQIRSHLLWKIRD